MHRAVAWHRNLQPFNCKPHALGYQYGLRKGGARQKKRKLFSTHSGYRLVRPTNRFEKIAADGLEGVITAFMAIGVVDMFEMVNVNHHHRERLALAFAAREFALQRVVQVAAVLQAG